MTSGFPRVLVLNHFAAPRGQAGGTRHVELFDGLPGWESVILAADRNYLTGERVESSAGFIAVRVSSYRANGWRRILNWASYAVSALFVGLRQGRVDVVYASSPHLLTPLAGWVIARLRSAVFVLEVRDLWPQVLVDMAQLRETSALYRALKMLELFVYRRAAVIVTMAEGTTAELRNRGIPQERLVFIPNGADPADFEPSDERDLLRRRFGFESFTAVYAGAHGPANGLDLLLDAAESLRSEPVHIVLVGGGVLKEELVARARAEHLDNVTFMDAVPKSEMADVLSAADVGLHVLANVELFRSAVSPNKLFDYMATSIPVITNCPGVVAATVVQSGAGLAVEPAGIAAGLRQMLQLSPGERRELGRSGREWIERNQSRTTMRERLSRLLDDVARGTVGTRRT